MTKKTIMLSAVALMAANALTFGPVSYKVNAADPTVVVAVDKLGKVQAQLDSQLKKLIDPVVTEVNTIVAATPVADILPGLWAKLEAAGVNEVDVERLLKDVVTGVIAEVYTAGSADLSDALNLKLNELAAAIGQSGDYPTLNKKDVADFVLALEKKAITEFGAVDTGNIADVDDLLSQISVSLDELIPQLWTSTDLKVVQLFQKLYVDKAALEADLRIAKTELEDKFSSKNQLKLASVALGLAYVKADLAENNAFGNAVRLSDTTYRLAPFNILGTEIKGLSLYAFDFTAPGLTFKVEGDYVIATSLTPITSSTLKTITATLRTDALIPSGLRGAAVFTQTVTLYPAGSVGGGIILPPIIDTGLDLVPNAEAIAQNISKKIEAALVGIDELVTNTDIFAIRALVEAELKSALTVDVTSEINNNNGTAEVKLSAADLTNVISQLDSVLNKANAALQAAIPDADPVKAILNLTIGNHNDVKITLNSDLINALKAKGIYAIAVNTNGVFIEVPLSELEGNAAMQITKVTNAAPQLSAGVRQVSDVFNFRVINADGNEKHEFKTPIRMTLPVNVTSGVKGQFLTLAKIDDDQLVNAGGNYNPTQKQVSTLWSKFSSYVVIENTVAFKDSNELLWAEEDILEVAAKGAIQGRPNGLFDPRAEITRAEFTAILVRALKIESTDATESFADVKDGVWYQSAVATAVAHGLVNGRTSTIFDPNAAISRSEMATITANVLLKEYGYKAVSDINAALDVFVDQGEVFGVHRPGVALVAQEGIVQGKGLGVYDPKGTFTRAEAALVVNKLLKLR